MGIESYIECGLRQVRDKPDLVPTRPPLGMLYLLILDTLRKAGARCEFDGWKCKDGEPLDHTGLVLALSMTGWDVKPRDVLWCWQRAALAYHHEHQMAAAT